MNIVIFLSGGTGTRLRSDIPKQYISVGGKIIAAYTLEEILKNPLVDAVQIVADQAWRGAIERAAQSFFETEKRKNEIIKGFSKPGVNRQLSIYNAITDISAYASERDVVLVQDAVRPLTSQETISACLTEIKGHDGALPVLQMKDTVYLSKDGKSITSLLDRDQLVAGQAPEAYVIGKYRKANEALLPEKILQINGAAEPAILWGMDVVTFPGDEGNFKITTMADLERFQEKILEK